MIEAYLSAIIGLLFLIVAMLGKAGGASDSFEIAMLTAMFVFFAIAVGNYIRDR